MSSTNGNGNGTSRPSVASTKALVSQAVANGLSGPAGDALVANLNATNLLGTVGVSPDDIDGAEATLVCVALDMSSSMSSYRSAVIDSFNSMLGALSGAKGAADILVSVWAFADAPVLLSGYEPVDRRPPLSAKEYRPGGCTALYDTVLSCMTGLVAYGEQLAASGVATKRILFVLSDGGDNNSKGTALDVRTAADGLIAEELYTLAYAAFGTADAAATAAEIGFPSVVKLRSNPKELRQLFRQVSASVIQLSQGTASPGGFF